MRVMAKTTHTRIIYAYEHITKLCEGSNNLRSFRFSSGGDKEDEEVEIIKKTDEYESAWENLRFLRCDIEWYCLASAQYDKSVRTHAQYSQIWEKTSRRSVYLYL